MLSNNMLSNKQEQNISMAYNEALKSPCLQKHGCVATLNGKIIATGHNNYDSHINNYFVKQPCTCHAEINTLYKIMKQGYPIKVAKENKLICC